MRYVDSLLNSINPTTPDSVLCYTYKEIAYSYRGEDNVKALEYAKKAFESSKTCINARYQWDALNNIGEAHRLMGNLDEAIKVHQQALSLAQIKKYKVKTGHSFSNLALVYKRSKNLVRAKEYVLKALASYAEAEYTDGYYTVYNNLGNLYHGLDKNDSALSCFRLARTYIGKDWDSAYYAQNYNNLSMIFWYLDHRDSSLIYSTKAYKLYKKFGTNADLSNAGIGLAEIYTDMGEYDKAKKLLYEMILVAKKASDKTETADGFWHYAVNAFAAGEYKTAYLYKDSAQKLYDEILNEEKLKSLNEASEKYGAEKKQLMINQLNIENSAKQNLLEEGKKTRLYMGLGLGAIILFSMYLFYTVKQRDKTNRIINEQKKEVEQQKSLIEIHQKETLDSINYAKRIQYSLLAHDALLNENLNEYFVLFKPKDIVSGDFHWATSVGSKFYLAVCDSTGHGVPGAFMSLININFMNEAINEKKIYQPNEVFNHVRQSLIQNVSQDGQKDGMDGILVCFEKGKLNYASANNAPLVISDNQIVEFKKDKMPVGAGERDASFNLHELKVKKGDVVYLYTDGFADQFGGEKGKKFKYKQLNELLLSVSQLPLAQQKQKLESVFQNWKGNLEQVDDVCIVGIRI
ncbi:MAG: tetratricopeptide repeat protein [Sphingobacteriaceae bacterium]|nr:tetratricopeptide repeat protein [Sphingobacteriaceae bacterium]